MKENKYDDDAFFEKYAAMKRSKEGLTGAGEWETLEGMLPDFTGKRVLDLGCGYGWHCIYAAEHGAVSVTGVDISEKMLETAVRNTSCPRVRYVRKAIEDADFPPESFDAVISSLAFHYIASFGDIAQKVSGWLTPGGHFIYSVEHPVFTAQGSQRWHYDKDGRIMHFPVDNYFYEGKRVADFLGEEVVKYHRALTSYLTGLLSNGFEILSVAEPRPTEHMMSLPGMKDELRRPMMLIVSAVKK